MAKTKAAKSVQAGDWCTFGNLTFLAGEPWEDNGKIYIPWGNGSVSEFRPDERLKLHQEEPAGTQ